MKQSLSVKAEKDAVARYMESIVLPPYDLGAVEARCRMDEVNRRRWRSEWIAAAAGLAIVVAAFAPSVLAQAERVLQAFTVSHGQTTRLDMNETSIDQLRADMPFVVVAPAGVPRNLHPTIHEIGAGTNQASALFEYSAGGGLPVVMISESSAQASPNGALMMTYRTGTHSARPPGRTFHIVVTPIVWTAHGTRITLFSMPGTLTRAQIRVITRSMQ